MNESIKAFLINYNKNHGWEIDDATLFESLMDAKKVYLETVNERRWWNDIFVVVEIDGHFIGFDSAETTGDNTPNECGWEFDPESICECKSIQETRTIYVEI
jgi:hypothetical protein